MGLIRDVKDDGFETEVLESPVPVLVDFWAPWCGPCQVVSPLLEKIAEEYVGDVLVVKMNIDQNQDIPAKLQVRSVPTLMMFLRGEILGTLVGMPEPQKIIDLCENALDEV